MKTTYSYLLVAISLLLLPHALPAQCAEDLFRQTMRRADSCEKVGNYELAFKKYKSAITDCPDKKAEAENAISKLFATINGLREKAQQALASVIARDLAKVQELIIEMEYETAYKILQSAASLGEDLGAKKAATIAGLIEVAYYFTETGKLAKADSLLQMANHIQPKSEATALLPQIAIEKDSVRKQALLQKTLPQLDLATWLVCEKRYFPDMVFVEGGIFTMGCNDTTDGDCVRYEKPLHEVSLDSFQISRTEVTVWQFFLYCAAKGIAMNKFATDLKPQGNTPIIKVDWFEAAAYSNWLTARRLEKGQARYVFSQEAGKSVYEQFETVDTVVRNHYRLPLEAEWEYAARGGKYQPTKHQRYSGGFSQEDSSLNRVAWWYENPELKTKRAQIVATRDSNALGLYDMTGNVLEWCEDEYDSNYYEKCKNKTKKHNNSFL